MRDVNPWGLRTPKLEMWHTSRAVSFVSTIIKLEDLEIHILVSSSDAVTRIVCRKSVTMEVSVIRVGHWSLTSTTLTINSTHDSTHDSINYNVWSSIISSQISNLNNTHNCGYNYGSINYNVWSSYRFKSICTEITMHESWTFTNQPTRYICPNC